MFTLYQKKVLKIRFLRIAIVVVVICLTYIIQIMNSIQK